MCCNEDVHFFQIRLCVEPFTWWKETHGAFGLSLVLRGPTLDVLQVNLEGGSIAIGHPFAATGGRLVLHAINSLRRRGARRALLSACAAGGLGIVVVLERCPTSTDSKL